MKITSFFCKLEVEHLDAPIDPDRIALQGETIVIGIMTPLVEWRITLTRADVGVLGGALTRLTGARP